MKSRILLLFSVFLGAWGLLIMRAAYLQILPNARLEKLERRQFETEISVNSRRGSIFDREGHELALSTPAYSLYADPSILDGRKAIARKLAKEFGQSFESIYAKLKDKKKQFVWLQRQIDIKTYERIKSWNIHGLSFIEEPKRMYPNGSLLSQTLGIVGSEGKGLEGVELKYDSSLRGNPKKFTVRKDARGRPLINDAEIFTESPEGNDLYLTVDRDIQYVLERELSTAMKEHEAESAMGIVLDAQTSAILAMASQPGFDFNTQSSVSSAHRRNRIISDSVEPGSTMKTFVIAGALRQKLLKPNSKYFCENGSFKIGDRIIREAEASHNFGFLTVSEILAFSSNIGTTKISFQLGQVGLKQTLKDFGFGEKTGVDLSGETSGIMQELPWNPHLMSNISFGHGIAVTPLQMATAYAAIANGGILKQPFIYRGINLNEEQLKSELKGPEGQKERRVLTSEEAATMRMMLSGVTAKGGSGVNARVPGYIVAGKTGTAQKVNPNGRGYLPNTYVSSFAGFIPAQDPRFVIYVVVDSPKKGYYGAQVAAPIFSHVASFAVRKIGLTPSILNETDLAERTKKVEKNVGVSISSENYLKENNKKTSETLSTVPELEKLTLREVIRQLHNTDIQVTIESENSSKDKMGLVKKVEPAAGEPIPENKTLKIILE